MYDELIAELRQYNNDGTEELRRQAAEAIEDLSEQLENETEYATALPCYVPQWIPVTERLPDNCVTVFAYYNNFITEAFYANYQWHELATYAIIPTTYWMPLPEPPEKEK